MKLATLSAFAFLVLAGPATLHAQFQQPTDEELKMTADPKAPGAAAVYLYREQTADDVGHVHSYYVRIKVLTENGRQLATVRIPSEQGKFQVAAINGRTIHSDGSVIPLTIKPEDLVNPQSNGSRQNMIVFTLPGVEAGSILEYRLVLRYDNNLVSPPRWEIQQPYFVHKAHYSFRPGHYAVTDSTGQVLDQLVWTATGKEVAVQNLKGVFAVDITDVPPIPDEEWMPPLNTTNWKVQFYYTAAHSGAEYWKTEGDRWAAGIETFIRPTDALKEAAASLISADDTDDDKARKIYAAVMKLENTDYSPVGSERKNEKESASAEDVWKQQSGSANSIALLYAALARAAGLQAWPMKVTNRNRALFDVNYMSMNQLNDIIVIVVIDGKDVYLDPGEMMCPFGSLQWEHELAGGLRTSATGTAVAVTPGGSYKLNEIQRQADLALDEQCNVNGTARYTMTGIEALYWRQLAIAQGEDEAKKQFAEAIRYDLPRGVEAEVSYFAGLDDYESDLIAVVSVTGSMGAAAGKQITLPGLFFEAGDKPPFVTEEKRIAAVDLRYAEQEQDNVTYQLPDGFSVESAPKTAAVDWTGSATLRISSAESGDSIAVGRVFARNFVLVAPEDYAAMHDFYQKLAAADQQQIVLSRADAAGGN